MSSNSLRRLTEKKGNKLSKILGINSGPSTEVIADMQARINNPLFKLSIADYEAMCGNKMMVKMMSKVIGCDVKQLKKFCKYINVFAKNIESSPKSIKKKIKETISINASKRRGSLHVLPEDILEKIVNKYETLFSKVKYKLKDWIPLEKICWKSLSQNPNAIELLKANPEKIYWWGLSENPNPEAIELLQKNIHEINWEMVSKNPNAIELLKKYPENISWHYLSKNPNQAAIELLEANPRKIDWIYLSTNSSDEAIKLLKANRDEIDWRYLSLNKNKEAIELLNANPEKINWVNLSENPEAIELLKEKIENENTLTNQEYLRLGYYNVVNWDLLSRNPNAIELLKENQDKIDWESLSKNPKAMELLKANPTKIDWNYLSSNPNAIELLRKNPNKIFWLWLSSNPAIFEAI